MTNTHKILVENLKERDHSVGVVVHGMVISE
jgi:hypothetical protein